MNKKIEARGLAVSWLIIFAVFLDAFRVLAEEVPLLERPVAGIMDNSFLVEEAYNQETGVVQHIFNGIYAVQHPGGDEGQSWNMAFTQEWPLFSQTHQFSYTIPYNFIRQDGHWEDGWGDILLNYRYQAYYDETTLTAFAPRASLVLPTGKTRFAFGENTVGGQFNLPFSTALNDRWAINLNAGTTFLPNAASAQGRDVLDFNLGGSMIFAVSSDFHLMLEWVGYWLQSGEPGLALRYNCTSFISPGMRTAVNFSNGSQLVFGLAMPIGLTPSSPDLGAFLYVSFEHFLPGYRKEKAN
jgi:hypothetical protein